MKLFELHHLQLLWLMIALNFLVMMHMIWILPNMTRRKHQTNKHSLTNTCWSRHSTTRTRWIDSTPPNDFLNLITSFDILWWYLICFISSKWFIHHCWIIYWIYHFIFEYFPSSIIAYITFSKFLTPKVSGILRMLYISVHHPLSTK